MSWKTDFVSRTLNQRYSAKISGGQRGYTDWSMIILGTIVFGALAIFLLLLVLLFHDVYETNKRCGRWETKIVHQNAYTTWVYSGKVMTPIYHPAGDYERSVCVEVKQ